MNTGHSGPSMATAAAAVLLQRSIVKQVKLLQRADDCVPGVFRNLCRLARKWNIAPEEFCIRLVLAGLATSRASEIKVVLLVKPERDAFIGGTLTWHKALSDAREKIWKEAGFTKEHRVAAQLIGWMRRLDITRLEHPAGTFELTEQQLPDFYK